MTSECSRRKEAGSRASTRARTRIRTRTRTRTGCRRPRARVWACASLGVWLLCAVLPTPTSAQESAISAEAKGQPRSGDRDDGADGQSLLPGSYQAPPKIVRDVVYGHKDGMALVYDVLQPQSPNGAGIVYVVSGGWFSRWEPPEVRAGGFAALLQRGFTVIVLHHGSAPRYLVPDAVSDVRRAVRHIRRNAALYEIDPERIGLFGGSTGGHLALMVALASDDGDPRTPDPGLRTSNRVAAVVAFYPPTDLRSLVGPNREFPALNFDPALAPTVSPLRFASADDPPVLLVHGEADGLIPIEHSVRLEAALLEAGARAELVRIPGGDHGFQNPEHRALAARRMLDWFEKYLRVDLDR